MHVPAEQWHTQQWVISWLMSLWKHCVSSVELLNANQHRQLPFWLCLCTWRLHAHDCVYCFLKKHMAVAPQAMGVPGEVSSTLSCLHVFRPESRFAMAKQRSMQKCHVGTGYGQVKGYYDPRTTRLACHSLNISTSFTKCTGMYMFYLKGRWSL